MSETETTETKTFDLLSAVQGISYPTSVVSIYLNVKAIRDLEAIEDALRAINPETEEDEETSLLAEREALLEQARKSAVHIEIQGVPRSILNAIVKQTMAKVKDRVEQAETVNEKLLLRSITKITDSEGRSANFDDEGLKALFKAMREPDFARLVDSVNELSYTTLKYEERVTDPNFS